MEKQLKATELRLNNLIYDVNNNLCCVSNLRKDLIIAKYLDIGSALGGVEDFKGVPLTEEILLRLGFEIEGLRSYYHSDLDLTIEFLNGKYAFAIYDFEVNPSATHYIMHCEFLHTLQNNIFALTGEELTFKK